MRLDKLLANKAFGSRKEVHQIIKDGRVTVNGVVILKKDQSIHIDDTVQRGTLVTLGVWWQSQSSDAKVGINAVTASRPTDEAWGSTFYDVQVNIRKV